MNDKKIKNLVLFIIFLSVAIRSFLAGTLDLGNDEVYYNTYALYPAWSHFDHPPMVGWMIRFFTFNTMLDQVFFIRLSSIVLGAGSSWIIFLIARLYGGTRSGLLAVVLITSSLYTSIIAGVFILPDSPQVFFWLLALYYFSISFQSEELNTQASWYFLVGGLVTGMSILSKYTSVFIWIGVLLFIGIYRKNWLKKKIIYISFLLSLLVQIPVLIWNIQNHFISFTYQGNRVVGLSKIRFDYFFTEILGEFFYNNPVNFVLIIFALYLVFFKKSIKLQKEINLILLVSLPLVFTFWYLSIFHSTLPHWTGPAITTLLIFTAVVYDKYTREKGFLILIPKGFRTAIVFAMVFVIIGYLQITRGTLTRLLVPSTDASELVSWDISLDMYGWKQLKAAMPEIYKNDIAQGKISKDPFLISWRWFPAANLDYYVATPLGLKLFAFGKLEQIHKYYWINQLRGPYPNGKDAYFICTNRDKKNPRILFRDHFQEYGKPDTVPVIRGGRKVMEFYIYRLKHSQYRKLPFKSFFWGQPIR